MGRWHADGVLLLTMSRKPRPSVTEVLRFSQQLSGLCARYNVEAWFVRHAKTERIELSELPHLPKSHIRSGIFAVGFIPDRPQHRPFRRAEWYVQLGDVGMFDLESELVGRMLKHVFVDVEETPLW
jgi:hypothetical protein